MSDYWIPSREWASQDAFLIGGGPSLSNFDFFSLKGRNVIGCNDAVYLGHEIVKYGIFGDAAWWHRSRFKLEVHPLVRLVTNAPSMKGFKIPGLLKMKRDRDGLHSGETLGWNYSTGAAAINLAISLGAQRIFLLGYDLTNKGTQSHWHQHNKKVVQDAAFARFIRGFEMVAKHLPEGLVVQNVTDGSSKLKCFQEISFEEFYEYLAPVEAGELV